MFEVFLSALHSKTPSEIYSITWHLWTFKSTIWFQNIKNNYEVSISSFSSSLFSSSLSESSSSPDDSESSSFKVLMSDSINISHSSNLWISNNYNNVYYTFLLCENYFKNNNENILLIFVTLFTLSLEISDICTIKMFLGSQNWQDYISNGCVTYRNIPLFKWVSCSDRVRSG